VRRERALGLVCVLALLALEAGGAPGLHDHGGHDAAVYDDHCALRVASLCGIALPAGAVPPAPRPLPAARRPPAPAPAGLAALPAAAVQPRAPPPSPAATPTA
jgi:hypothetical protein